MNDQDDPITKALKEAGFHLQTGITADGKFVMAWVKVWDK